MILIDTHIWLWWATDPGRLSEAQIEAIESHESDIIGVSAISCWEVAKLVQIGRISLGRSVREFLALALSYPGIQLLPLTPEIAVASTHCPANFAAIRRMRFWSQLPGFTAVRWLLRIESYRPIEPCGRFSRK